MSGFVTYLQKMFPDFVAERPILLGVADEMERFYFNGKNGDVINIEMPPRLGKSFIGTAFSVFLLLREPQTRILRCSYSSSLAEQFSTQVRLQYMDFFKKINIGAPTITGTRSRWRLVVNEMPNHIAVGVNGTLTGFGVDVAIIDDTCKNFADAVSAAYKRQLDLFRESVLFSRLEGRRKIINIGTRWSVDDWFSHFPDAKVVRYPAVIDGASICEGWRTLADLEQEKNRIAPNIWDAQYMQQPTLSGKYFLFNDWEPVFYSDDVEGEKIAIIDPSTGEGGDYFTIGIYKHEGGFVYLERLFAKQQTTINEVAEWLQAVGYSYGWIETNGVGRKVLKDLRAAGCENLVGFTTKDDKYSRAWRLMDKVKNYLRVSVKVEEKNELINQMQNFPIYEHDDILDNILMIFERLHI